MAIEKMYTISLGDFDLGQVIDGLEVRARAWEDTAAFCRSGDSPEGFVAEECNDAEEAERIAAHYRVIISRILEQRETQS
jgi:hypothetical protein